MGFIILRVAQVFQVEVFKVTNQEKTLRVKGHRAAW